MTVVLEVSPNDPFVYCSPDDFDAYIVLDPTLEIDQKNVFAFPRPLEKFDGPLVYEQKEVPWIGSFGFATPKKGFEKLVKKREHVLMEYFKMNETQDQVKISAKTDIIPFNGFSYFKIKYNGDMPGSLMDAYGKLNEKNIESPRDKYLKFRNGKS